jgi:subtilisin family serine protease
MPPPIELRHWIYGDEESRRYTQDSPIMPDVWMRFGSDPEHPHDLLLTPHADSSAGELAKALRALPSLRRRHGLRLAYNRSYVVVRLKLDELLHSVLPLSAWWRRELAPVLRAQDAAATIRGVAARLERRERDQGRHALHEDETSGNAVWLIGLVGRIVTPPGATWRAIAKAGFDLLAAFDPDTVKQEPRLWVVNRNREVRLNVWRSRVTVKADAAQRVFQLSCRDLRWAVVDSGIDAAHPAFAAGADGSRVTRTLDFTRLRGLFAVEPDDNEINPEPDMRLREIEGWLDAGRTVDWKLLEDLLVVGPDDAQRVPTHEHGTHVAGVLAADWRVEDAARDKKTLEADVQGVCPDLELYDLRVIGEDGTGDEFAMLAALQYVRWLNANSSIPVLHGVNLSLSIEHDVGAYACGRTPVCEECERLVASGTVVVAAAGNQGRARYTAEDGESDSGGYRSMSITDPGNCDAVITVGSTHRIEPHTYGVSYFSSKGPTGDGRRKPDLLAPGEKITAPVPGGGLKTLDGTSQAAPHVSGAAALLMARHPELIGDPGRVKAVLCGTATDLGRLPDFQGAGVVDALRALQAV